MKQLIPVIAAAAVLAPAASAQRPPADAGVRIYCEDEAQPGAYFVSRAAVLQTDAADPREVIVASGHTFRSEDGGVRACWARTEASARPVSEVHLAPEGDDWAVAETDGRFREPVRRWRVPARDDRMLALIGEGGEITLFPGRPAERRCRLAGRVTPEQAQQGAPQSAFTHDCPAGPGASGSPLTADINGERRLVGVYVGRLRERSGAEHVVGVAQPMEGELLIAVDAAMDTPEPPR